MYALGIAKDIAALNAVSQNLMHANLSVTDGICGVLSGQDVKAQIARLSEKADDELGDLDVLAAAVLRRMGRMGKSYKRAA